MWQRYLKKYRLIIPKSIVTISIRNIRFLKEVLRAYPLISRKHAFWKIDPPLTLQIAENEISWPITSDPVKDFIMDAEQVAPLASDYELMVKTTSKKHVKFENNPFSNKVYVYIYTRDEIN